MSDMETFPYSLLQYMHDLHEARTMLTTTTTMTKLRQGRPTHHKRIVRLRYLQQWSYHSLALSNRYYNIMVIYDCKLSRPNCIIHCRSWWGHDSHDDVIKWKHFPRYWPFVRGIHRSPVNSPHKGQWRGALFFSLMCVWINGWVNNGEAGDLRRYRIHYDVTVMAVRIIKLA